MKRLGLLLASVLLLLGLGGGVAMAAPRDIPSLTNCAEMRLGATGDCVKSLQQSLNAVGLQVKEDGKFNLRTKLAVRYFQSWAHLPSDGNAVPDTIGSLDRAANSPPPNKPGMPQMPEMKAAITGDANGTQICLPGRCYTYVGRADTARLNDALNAPLADVVAAGGTKGVCSAVNKTRLPRAGTVCELVALAAAVDLKVATQDAVKEGGCLQLSSWTLPGGVNGLTVGPNNGRNCVP